MKNISNNKKIKVITCHNVYNYGASLQEYALLTFINKLGYDAQGINYTPSYLSNHFNLWSVSNPKWDLNILTRYIYLALKLPKRLINLKRKKNFDLFSKKYLNVSDTNYKTNDDLKKDIPEADAFICGSDQIWNSFFENGKDPAFYLDFVPDNKLKISYAASFATETIENNIKSFVKNKVNKIDFVSVREESALNILNKLGINKTQLVLDPVFLIDKKEWLKFTKPITTNYKYILIYDSDSNPQIKKLAKNISKNKGWRIVSISPNIKYSHKNYHLEGPEVFLSLINNASFIITNSFHAIAFSIIFNKQFIAFNRKEEINARLRDIVKLFNIQHILFPYKKIVTDININNIDYNKVNSIVQKQITISKHFLSTSLNRIK